MRICEQWKQLRKELEAEYKGITINEYGNTTINGKVTRGPHITLMIPSKVTSKCPCCHTSLVEVDIPNPTSDNMIKLAEIIGKYLCDVSLNVTMRHASWGGNTHVGWFYEIIFDKVVID